MTAAQADEPVAPAATSSALLSHHYEHGRRLFDAGYYWEAHEAWEHLWILLGRRGPAAETIKGLIKLAAAGVKVLEGRPTGAERHATRAVELLSGAQSEAVAAAEMVPAAEAALHADVVRARQIAARYLAAPYVMEEMDPWSPAPLAGWSLQSSRPG